MSNCDTVLFVQGIPLDLDKKGLANLFARAGPVKNVRIIPPKNATYTSTFGFVEFSNRTIAATALEMFNNYKIGTKYLSVGHAQQRNKQQDTSHSRNSVASNGRPLSVLSNHDLNQSNDSDKISRRSTIGRGSLIHQNQPRHNRSNYDLSRPYARKILSRQSSKISSNKEAFVDADEPSTEPKLVEELKIGELYPVYITHVNTPSNFFVHLITAKEKTANLINNMDNYYRNGLHHENADLNKFCETKPASIRCKLANIRPPRGSSEWSQKAQDTMDTLYNKQEDTLFAKILSIDEFEPSSGRFETIYGVDLIYGGEESIISYFIQNALAIQENESPEEIIDVDFVKLKTGQRYKVIIQFIDESLKSPYFFVSLTENFTKLELLESELQKISSDRTKFKYVENTNQLKMYDTLEALFENDSKWYRVQVRNLQPLEIYFLDFGNSETIVQLVPKTLRYRLKFDSDEEIELFKMDYQAIRCRYESSIENKMSLFLDKIAEINDLEAGFELTVVESGLDQATQQESYVVSLESIDNSIDQEEELEELEENKVSIQLETDSVIDGVSFVHIESLNEFYVQTQETLRLFIAVQGKIQRLLELMLSNKSFQENKQEMFKIGDFVFGKFLSDLNWYRAVIIRIGKKSTEECESENLPNNGLFYDVYFLDYGNKQENLPSSLIYSFDSVKQLNESLNLMPSRDLNRIIEMPFQAICCQLVDKKNNTRNNEILKSLVHECLNFSIRIAGISKEKILDSLEINKYLVHLSTDGKCLQDQFENETKSDKSALIVNNVLECKLSNLDTNIYINLIEQSEQFSKLETQLVSDGEQIVSKWHKAPSEADLVLAKFELDEETSAWCRAKIIKKKANLYDVFYLDYGNKGLSLALEDLAPLGTDYSLTKYPAFAYKIQLHNIDFNVDKHGEFLADFIDQSFKIKLIGIEQEEWCTCCVVELWNMDMTKSLNRVIDEQCISDNIEHTNVDQLFMAKETTELKVNVKYVFMDDLVKPFYFCLSDDLDMRSQLDTELNEFYLTNSLPAQDFCLNDYLAVQSDNNWYRVQIKKKLDTNSIFVFYIDYGFDELIELNDQNKQRVSKLDARFFKYPRFVFGTALVDPMADKTDELINFDHNDNQTLRETLEEYFTASDSEQFDLVILSKMNTAELGDNFVQSESYYTIEMYNQQNMCLNEMIVASKKKKTSKATRPALIKLSIEQMPKQKPKNGTYCVFARSLDNFYVYNEEQVLQVQLKTQETCAKIMQEMDNFENQGRLQEDEIQVGDLVYGKYDDDETWYRCIVTNCDQKSSKFELFYLDFGNIEIVNKSDVLAGWSDEHIEAFVKHEPQAYKCRLYGLEDKQYSNEEKTKFKHLTSDKVFCVNFIKVSADGMYEVSLQDANKPEINVHMLCLDQDLASFISFDKILKLNRTSEENRFFINLLNGF